MATKAEALGALDSGYQKFRAPLAALDGGRGERPTPEGVDYSDADAWNEKFALQAKPGHAALDAWDAAYRAYCTAAGALPENLYGEDPEKGRPLIGNRLLQAAGIHHFEEHRPDLEKWLRSRT